MSKVSVWLGPPVIQSKLQARFLAGLFIFDVVQIVILSPMACFAEVVIRQSRFSTPVVTDRQEDIVETLAEPVIKGVFLHDGVQERRDGAKTFRSYGVQFLAVWQPPRQR